MPTSILLLPSTIYTCFCFVVVLLHTCYICPVIHLFCSHKSWNSGSESCNIDLPIACLEGVAFICCWGFPTLCLCLDGVFRSDLGIVLHARRILKCALTVFSHPEVTLGKSQDVKTQLKITTNQLFFPLIFARKMFQFHVVYYKLVFFRQWKVRSG